jgi:hypothetical protein
MNIDLQKRWWNVPAVAGGVGLLLLILVDELFPSLELYAMLLFLLLVGGSFLWVFGACRKFWAVAPGVGALGFAVAVIVTEFVPEPTGWVAALILGVTAFVMAAIPNPEPTFKGIYVIGAFILLIGFIMAPLAILWKVILCVASAALGAYLLWRNRDVLFKSSTS